MCTYSWLLMIILEANLVICPSSMSNISDIEEILKDSYMRVARNKKALRHACLKATVSVAMKLSLSASFMRKRLEILVMWLMAPLQSDLLRHRAACTKLSL